MADHDRVDHAFSHFDLRSRTSYGDFLTAQARALAALEPVVSPAVPRLPLLARDLAALDRRWPDALPSPDPASDAFRWGLRYALEGSRLGGAMLARRVGEGLPKAFLSAAHGKGEWAAFQLALDDAAAGGGEGWRQDAVQGVRAAFALFHEAAAGDVTVTIHG